MPFTYSSYWCYSSSFFDLRWLRNFLRTHTAKQELVLRHCLILANDYLVVVSWCLPFYPSFSTSMYSGKMSTRHRLSSQLITKSKSNLSNIENVFSSTPYYCVTSANLCWISRIVNPFTIASGRFSVSYFEFDQAWISVICFLPFFRLLWLISGTWCLLTIRSFVPVSLSIIIKGAISSCSV